MQRYPKKDWIEKYKQKYRLHKNSKIILISSISSVYSVNFQILEVTMNVAIMHDVTIMTSRKYDDVTITRRLSTYNFKGSEIECFNNQWNKFIK